MFNLTQGFGVALRANCHVIARSAWVQKGLVVSQLCGQYFRFMYKILTLVSLCWTLTRVRRNSRNRGSRDCWQMPWFHNMAVNLCDLSKN